MITSRVYICSSDYLGSVDMPVDIIKRFAYGYIQIFPLNPLAPRLDICGSTTQISQKFDVKIVFFSCCFSVRLSVLCVLSGFTYDESIHQQLFNFLSNFPGFSADSKLENTVFQLLGGKSRRVSCCCEVGFAEGGSSVRQPSIIITGRYSKQIDQSVQIDFFSGLSLFLCNFFEQVCFSFAITCVKQAKGSSFSFFIFNEFLSTTAKL